MKCSMCGSTSVTQHVETEKIAYKKSFLQVPMHYSLCADCGHEFVPAEQIKINDKAVLAAKRTADGLLSPEEIYSIREALGLTQAQAAEAFGGGRNAFSKYERGEVAQSEPMDKLLRLVSRMPGLLQELIGAAQGVSEASSNSAKKY